MNDNTDEDKPVGSNAINRPTSIKDKLRQLPLWAKIIIPSSLAILIAVIVFAMLFLQKINSETKPDSQYTSMTPRQIINDINSNLSKIAKPVADISEYQRNSKSQPKIAYKLEEDNFSTLPDISYRETLGNTNNDSGPGATNGDPGVTSGGPGATNLSEEDINKISQAAEDYFVGNNWIEKIFPSATDVDKMNHQRYYVLNDLFVCTYSIIDNSGIMLECASLADFENSQNETKDYYDAYKQYAKVYEDSIKENPVVLTVKNGAKALPGYGNKQNDDAVVDGFDYTALNIAELTDLDDSNVNYYYRPVNNDWRAYTLQKLENASLDYPACNSLNLDSDPIARAAMANTLCYIGGDSNEVIDYNNYWQNDKCSDLATCYTLGKRRPIEACSSGSGQYFAKFDEDGEVTTCISIDEIIAIVGADAWQSGDWSNTPTGDYIHIGNIFAADQMPDSPVDSKCPTDYFAIAHGGYPDVDFYTCLNRKDESYLQNSCETGYSDVFMTDGSRKCWNTNYTPLKIEITGDDNGDGIGTGTKETIDPNGPEWM